MDCSCLRLPSQLSSGCGSSRPPVSWLRLGCWGLVYGLAPLIFVACAGTFGDWCGPLCGPGFVLAAPPSYSVVGDGAAVVLPKPGAPAAARYLLACGSWVVDLLMVAGGARWVLWRLARGVWLGWG
jgi:hypothetical protein